MEVLIYWVVGCVVLYFIIRIALDNSDITTYLRKNNELLNEILETLKEDKSSKIQNNKQPDEGE